jgi:hypothetical protein
MKMLTLTARMDSAGVRLYDDNGLFILLSHDQVFILRLLARSQSLSHYELCHVLFGVRSNRDVISNTKRASLSRSLRRLSDARLITRIDTKSIAITDGGKSLIDWLVNEWGYDKIATVGSPIKKTLTEYDKNEIG